MKKQKNKAKHHYHISYIAYKYNLHYPTAQTTKMFEIQQQQYNNSKTCENNTQHKQKHKSNKQKLDNNIPIQNQHQSSSIYR